MLPGVQIDQQSINGRLSYARQQAAQFRHMHAHFASLTQNVDAFIASKGDGTVPLLPISISLEAEEEDDEVPRPTAYSTIIPDGELAEYTVAAEGEPAIPEV